MQCCRNIEHNLNHLVLDATHLVTAQTVTNPSEMLSDPVFSTGLILIGLAVGVAIGLSGLGGAPLLLPSLVLIGIPPQLIIGADLAFIFVTKLVAAVLHSKDRNVNWNALIFLVIPVIPSMIIASWVWSYIKENYGSGTLDSIILILLGTILAGVSLYLLKNNVMKKENVSDDENKTNIHKARKFTSGEKSTFLGTGGIVSFITQITATGAGAMTLPILVRKCHCPPKHVAGTSVVFGVAISAVGATLHYTMGNVPLPLVGLLLAGSIPGVIVGVKMTNRISGRKLIIAFTGIIMIAAIFLLSRAFGIL